MKRAGLRISGVWVENVCAMLLQIVCISLCVCPDAIGQTENDGYLNTVQPQIEEFVRTLPLPAGQVAAAAKIIADLQPTTASLDATVLLSDVMAMPSDTLAISNPGSGMLCTSCSQLHVLHQVGHHVLYGLLPEPMRPLQWHPTRCGNLGDTSSIASEAPQSASEPYDSFAEASAYFFVLAYGSYQHVQGQTVDPAAIALWALCDTPAGLDACVKSPILTQLRTLASLYGPLLVSDPAKAYADFYTVCLGQSRRSIGWPMPARTMTEWLLSRQLYGGLAGVALTVDPAAMMDEFISDGRQRLTTCAGQAHLDAEVNGQNVSGAKAVEIVQPTRMKNRDGLVILQLGSATRLLLGPNTACETLLMDDVTITAGEAYVEGPATVRTSICTVLTDGNSVVVRVTRVGETMLGVISGTATLGLRGGKEILVNAGETVTVMGDGKLLGPGQADPLQVAVSLPLCGAQIGSGPLSLSGRQVAAADTASTPIPHAPGNSQPETAVQVPENDAGGAALLATTSQWQIHTPKMLREAVLCMGLDGENHPADVSAVFPATVRSVNLYLDMTLGGEKQLKIRWRRGDKSLSGRIVRASGSRQMLNALTPKSGSSFLPGEYQVDITIDDTPAATLKFVVTE